MKHRLLLLIFAGILASISLSSYQDGYATNGKDGTGATSANTGCSCHGATTAIGTKVELDSAGIPVTSYRPGMSYTVKISATNTSTTSYPKFGFQLGIVKVSGAGTNSATQGGIWGTPLPTGVKNTPTSTSGLPIPFIEHNFGAITATSGTGGVGTTYVESIPWTAPATGTGSIKIYGVILASNGNGSNSGDNAQVATPVTITEAAPAIVASVTIAITGGSNNSCSGSSITFTATPTNGGTAPTYQWKVNGTNAGTGATFTSTTLTNGQVVTCVMTSNLSGVTGNPATSNAITMVVKAKTSGTINQAICQGQSYFFNGANRTTAGTYLDTLVNAAGCDSFLTLNLTVKLKSASTLNISICSGQTYFFNGANLTTVGTYLDTFQNAVGCDSVVTLNLTVKSKSSSTISQSICSGQTYLFNGVNLATAGTYLDTFQNAVGCDSVVTLSLTVKPKSSSTMSQSICSGQSYLFNGANLTTPGTYLDTFQNAVGCDSIVTLLLTVKSKTTGTINKSICNGQSYYFNGVNHTTAGTFLDTIPNVAGCDSIITLNLSISTYTSGTANASICQGQSYFFNGNNLTTTGTYKDTFTVSGSCDSIVTLSLTVKQPTSATINKHICAGQSYLFNGVNLITAGTYKDTLVNVVGCDSLLTLNLSVSNSTQGNISATICQGHPYLFNGVNLTTSGIYKDTLQNTAGCDSILTLNLSVTSSTFWNVAATICQGQLYSFNGVNVTTTGTYKDTLQNTAGCDSIVTLSLSVTGYTLGTASATICQGQSYSFNGTSLTTAGTYKDTFTVSGSCDSIVTLTLTVNPLPTVSVTQTSTNTITATAGFASYEWYYEGTLLTTTTSEVLTINQNGHYTVKVTSGGCSATSAQVNALIEGIHDVSVGQMKLYPNPANQQLTVEVANWNQLPEGVQVNIYDVLGNVLVSEKLVAETTTLNVEQLQKGIYFARVNDSFVRFVKE